MKANPLSKAVESRARPAQEQVRTFVTKQGEVPRETSEGETVEFSVQGIVKSVAANGDATIQVVSVRPEAAQNKTPQIVKVQTQESHPGGY